MSFHFTNGTQAYDRRGVCPLWWVGHGGCAEVAELRLAGSILAHSCPANPRDLRRVPLYQHAQEGIYSTHINTVLKPGNW